MTLYRKPPPRFPRCALSAALGVLLLTVGAALPGHAASGGEMLVSTSGVLPTEGRIVVRSGLAWLTEENALFSAVGLALAEGLTERGLTPVPVEPSEKAPPPKGTEAVRNAPLPPNKGMRQRIMSVNEAASRMRAMQLAREGKLPQARLGGAGRNGQGKPRPQVPALTHPELIRFAISQEQTLPALRGHIAIPGRVPEEIRMTDPAIAEYALTAEFAMLWPAAGSPDTPEVSEPGRGLALGWHLLELVCYDLAPAKQGNPPARCWSATIQRVAYSANLWSSLPDMASAALNEGWKKSFSLHKI